MWLSSPKFFKCQKQNLDLKAIIAKTAPTLIEDGDSTMVEAGATTALPGRYLLGKQK